MAPPDDSKRKDPGNDEQSIEDILNDLPPAQLLVLKTLAYEGGLSVSELCQVTRLPKRTIRHSLQALQEQSLVEKDHYTKKGRVVVYGIPSGVELPGKFGPEVSAREDMPTREEDCSDN